MELHFDYRPAATPWRGCRIVLLREGIFHGHPRLASLVEVSEAWMFLVCMAMAPIPVPAGYGDFGKTGKMKLGVRWPDGRGFE